MNPAIYKRLQKSQNEDKLTEIAKAIFLELYNHFLTYESQATKYDNQIPKDAKQNAMCQEIMKIEGVGYLTASAVVVTIGNAKALKNSREVAAWLGIVPKQHSSGSKIRLSGISKRGDCYVRKLLIHGARSVVKMCGKKADKRSQ